MANLLNDEAKCVVESVDFAPLKDKNVLITGASGLIGLYLVATLNQVKEKYNIKVTIWTNNTVPEYFASVLGSCKHICGDITDLKLFEQLSNYDCIIHAAGYGQPLKFIKDKIKTIKINTEATVRLLEHLNKDGKFLFVSSSEVYNGLDHDNITEDMMGNTNTNHFRSCYIEGKKCGESICHAFTDHGYNIKIARLSLAYGPGTRMDDERVFNTFIKKGLTEENIVLLDHGTAVRTYCYITDAVEMLWNICLHGKYVVYNVGGMSRTSIYDLAATIAKSLKKGIILPEFQQPLQGNPKIVNVSCSRYINEFKKEKFVHLNTGIDRTIDWYKLLST